jgi:glycosyltransferase involved in cell wall biosynthesis
LEWLVPLSEFLQLISAGPPLMKIATYIHPERTWQNVSGVGKHINNMTLGLDARGEVEVSLISALTELQADRTMPAQSPLRNLPLSVVPHSRRRIEWAWNLLRFPNADKWAIGTDWVYAPAESYLPLKRSRMALTIHCVNWLEDDLPWSRDPGILRLRSRWKLFYRPVRTDKSVVVLTVSEFLKGRLVEICGIEPERIHVVGNGVEPAYFHASGDVPEKLRDLRPYLLVVGGLTARKSGDVIIAIARELQAMKSPVKIAVAGWMNEDPYKSAFKECSNLVDVGYIGVDTGLPAALLHSTALLFPSRYETFGIPAVEAMAAGTLAIVSHFAAFPEVVGDAGLVVDTSKPAEIARMADELAKNSGLREEYVRRGKVRAESFRWSHCVDRLMNALTTAR